MSIATTAAASSEAPTSLPLAKAFLGFTVSTLSLCVLMVALAAL
jgi:hypothetical protein